MEAPLTVASLCDAVDLQKRFAETEKGAGSTNVWFAALRRRGRFRPRKTCSLFCDSGLIPFFSVCNK